MHNGLEAFVWIHKIPSIGALGELKHKAIIMKELEEYLDHIR